jgi:phytoene desaturase
LLVGGNPFTTSSIYTLIHCLERKWGVYFPKGGTGALVRALVKLFQELGGEIKLNTEISEIMTNGTEVGGKKKAEADVLQYVVVPDLLRHAHDLPESAPSQHPVRTEISQALGGHISNRSVGQRLLPVSSRADSFGFFFGASRV